MIEVGNRFAKNEYFISELVMSGVIFAKAMEQLKPLLGDIEDAPSKGIVIIGTVKGDIHDIGKNIVVTLLRGSGFTVIDLGIDVPAEVFIKTVQEKGAKVLGLSALLNFTFPEMKNVIDQLQAAGSRDKVKVIIGGAPSTEQGRQNTGVDHFT